MSSTLVTYDASSFKERFLESSIPIEQYFREDYELFFCIPLGQVAPHTKTPVPSCKESSHIVLLITGGSMHIQVGAEQYILKANNLLVLQAGKIFSIQYVSADLEGWGCHFLPELLTLPPLGNSSILSWPLLQLWSPSFWEIAIAEKTVLEDLFVKIEALYQAPHYWNKGLVQCYVLTLLQEITVHFLHPKNISPSSTQYLLLEFKSLLYSNLQQAWTIKELAQALYVSPNYLNKVIKRWTGQSASSLLQEIKLTEAKYLLCQTQLSIHQIALEVGYLDASYFSRSFKKKYHCSPSSFRQQASPRN